MKNVLAYLAGFCIALCAPYSAMHGMPIIVTLALLFGGTSIMFCAIIDLWRGHL